MHGQPLNSNSSHLGNVRINHYTLYMERRFAPRIRHDRTNPTHEGQAKHQKQVRRANKKGIKISPKAIFTIRSVNVINSPRCVSGTLNFFQSLKNGGPCHLPSLGDMDVAHQVLQVVVSMVHDLALLFHMMKRMWQIQALVSGIQAIVRKYKNAYESLNYSWECLLVIILVNSLTKFTHVTPFLCCHKNCSWL